MRLFLLTFATLGFLTLPAQADHAAAAQVHDITVKVNGLVCDFCARAVEKVFGERADVEGIDVDLDTHSVTIDMKEGADITDEEITKLITDSGYNVVEITRAADKTE
ncbi:MAG: hypothetical protein DHS20C02_09900 [Micavibrio sp.]|nr:MAG: hypothetical protein DHS20C02_09900 [Micavibrio sp.]